MFGNKKPFNFNSLRKLTARAKIELLKNSRNSYGTMLLSALTPTQLAELFPDYYKKNIDIGGFIAAATSKRNAQQQQQMEQQISRTVHTEVGKREAETRARGRREKEAEKQLTPEQKAAIEELKKGQIAANDPRLAFLSSLSPEQLKNVGVGTVTNKEGKTFYKWLPTESASLTDDQIKEKMIQVSAGGPLYESIIKAEGTNKYGDPYNTSLGYMKSPKPLTEMTMDEALEWGDKVRAAQGLNSSAKGAFQIVNTTQREAMKALGFSGDDRFSAENQRRMALWIAKTQGLKAWEGFKFHPEMREKARIALERGASPDIVRDFTAEQIAAYREQQTREEEARRIGTLGRYVGSYDMSQPEGTIFVPSKHKPEDLQSGKERLFNVGATMKSGNVSLDPRLVRVMTEASKDLPEGWRVEMIPGGGVDPRSSTENHPSGLAMDVQIVDDRGRVLNNRREGPDWKHYEKLYRSATIRGSELYPDQKFIWGGTWNVNSTVTADSMHYQIVKKGVGSQGSINYSFEGGNQREDIRPWAMSEEERAAYDERIRRNLSNERNTAKVEPKPEIKPLPKQEPKQEVLHNPSLTEPTPKVIEPPPREPKRDPREFLSGKQAPVLQNKEQAPPVPSKEQGGDVQVASKEISAYPIGGIGSDNTVVVDKDQKPVFTMDTKREAAIYSPGDSKVSVIPQERMAKGPMEDQPSPDTTVDEKISQVRQEMQQAVDGLFKKVNKAQGIGSPTVRDPHMIDSLAEIRVPFLNPSYYRAMTRTRFQETGDAIDQHHYSDKTASIS
jgi:hypothetical protein